MKSKSYICPYCGEVDEFKPSLWQCLREKIVWRCDKCGEHLESSFDRGLGYWLLLFLLAGSLTLVLYLASLLKDASPYLVFYFLIIRIFLDLAILRKCEIKPQKAPVLSRFEAEEISDADLVPPRTIK